MAASRPSPTAAPPQACSPSAPTPPTPMWKATSARRDQWRGHRHPVVELQRHRHRRHRQRLGHRRRRATATIEKTVLGNGDGNVTVFGSVYAGSTTRARPRVSSITCEQRRRPDLFGGDVTAIGYNGATGIKSISSDGLYNDNITVGGNVDADTSPATPRASRPIPRTSTRTSPSTAACTPSRSAAAAVGHLQRSFRSLEHQGLWRRDRHLL